MKRYEVRGMMEWHPEFRVGRTRLKVAFTGGHLSAGGCTPAVFETADPVVQKVIESSGPFIRGVIKVVGGGRSDRRVAGSPVCPPPRPEGAATYNEPMEFGTLGEAQDFLQKSKGVQIDEMLTPKDCIARAAGLGISMTIRKCDAE